MANDTVMTRIDSDIHQKISVLKAQRRDKSISEVLRFLFEQHEKDHKDEKLEIAK